MSDGISILTGEVIRFRDERDWAQFHSLKDNVLSILIEASELAEAVRWKPEDEVPREKIKEELADVLYWVLLTAHDEGVDLPFALREKLKLNEQRYPVDKARGNARKYDQL